MSQDQQIAENEPQNMDAAGTGVWCDHCHCEYREWSDIQKDKQREEAQRKGNETRDPPLRGGANLDPKEAVCCCLCFQCYAFQNLVDDLGSKSGAFTRSFHTVYALGCAPCYNVEKLLGLTISPCMKGDI